VQDLRNIHCYLVLVKYVDDTGASRSLILVFQEKVWTVASVGNNVKAICATFTDQFQQWDTVVSSGPDVTQIMQDPNTAVPVTLITSLTPHGNSIQAKTPLTAGVAIVTSVPIPFEMCVDSENFSRCYNLVAGQYINWINNAGATIIFTNSAGLPIYFFGHGQNWTAPGATGYSFPYTAVDGNGKFLGLTVTATMANCVVNQLAIEFQAGKLWGNPQFQ
jgi:hypothetical protein